tara:strand:+ start:427 stop:765 length:339 start_codon:yes stop_codon:yes gene_type:complete
MANKKKTVPITEVRYYFDGVGSERTNKSLMTKKFSQIMDLQQQLLTLPEHKFFETIDGIRALIISTRQSLVTEHENIKSKGEESGSQKLYDKNIEIRNKRLVSSQTDKVSKL